MCHKLVLPQEIDMLTLIYEDLASRNEDNKLTFQNFLNFFNLTGLWGAKLFRQFNEDELQLIGLEEFLYGICTCYAIQRKQPRLLSTRKLSYSTASSRRTRKQASSSKISSKWYHFTDTALQLFQGGTQINTS